MNTTTVPTTGAAAIRAAAEVLRTHARVAVLTHTNPDADTLGSGLALGMMLASIGHDATVYASMPLPPDVLGMPGVETLIPIEEFQADGRLVVCVDCASIARVAITAEQLAGAARVLNIDHHPTNTDFADLNVVLPQASSTSELIWDIAQELGIEPSRDAATCLYVGLATDCGFFSFNNTTPRALRLAAALIELGVSPEQVYRSVVQSRTAEQLRLIGAVLADLRTDLDGAVVYGLISNDLFQRTNTSYNDTEGVIDALRTLRGARVAVLLRDSPSGTRVSLRSHDVDVRAIAIRFGGGGHVSAAGCTINADLQTATAQVLAEVRALLQCPVVEA